MTEGTQRVGPGVVFVLPAFLLGLLAITQAQTQSGRAHVPSYSSQESVSLTETALALQREQATLKEELGRLRVELEEVQARGANVSAGAAELYTLLAQLRQDAGLTELRGPGVILTLDDAHLPPSRDTRSVASAIVHSQDITDAINAAWGAGARAITVNDERITGASSCVGATIQINGTLMSPPFRIAILGQTDELLRTLAGSSSLTDLRARRAVFGLGFELAPAEDLRIAPYTGTITIRYATSR